MKAGSTTSAEAIDGAEATAAGTSDPAAVANRSARLDAPTAIHVLVMPEAHLLDVAAPVQVLGHRSFRHGTASPAATLRRAGDGRRDRAASACREAASAVSLVYIAVAPEQRSAQGLLLADLAPLPDTVGPGTWLLIAGTRDAGAHLDDPPFVAARDWLRRRAPDYALRLAICSGSLLAGSAGLLDGRRCTTHHDLVDVLRRRAPRALVQEDRLFVEDGDWITSAGIATGLDLALHLVARVRGHDVATRIARETVLYHRRAGADSQESFWLEHRNHVVARVHRVQDRVMAEPGGPWSARVLAAEVGLGERQLRRVFAAATGTALGDYLVRARLELAARLLAETRFGLEEIAARAGFGSERSLRRHWTRRHGAPPSTARRRRERTSARSGADGRGGARG